MNKLAVFIAIQTLSFLFACTSPSGPVSSPAIKAQEEKTAPQISKDASGQKWDSILAAAKKEGIINIYASWGAPTRAAITKAFKDKYGIDVAFTSFGRGAEFVARYRAEKNAGIHLPDVFGLGGSTLLVSSKPAGFLASMEPFLLLPEVKDPKAWRRGIFPFLDKDKTSIQMAGSTMRFIAVNTNLVRKDEIASYKDVLKPQYKGKVTLNDPSVSGAGVGFFGHLSFQIWSEQEAIDYLKQLVGNEVTIMREQRLQTEWLAQGRNPVALALDPNTFAEFIQAGAPIAPVVVKDGVYITTGDGGVSVPEITPHRNAATLFINWLLSREGQTLFARTAGAISMRVDVPAEGLHPGFVPGPDERTFMDSEEYVLKRGELLGVARKIFAEMQK